MRRIFLPLISLLMFAAPAFAQFDFPNSPTANQIISGPAGQAMKWDGTKWVAQFGPAGGPFAPEAPLDGNSYLRTNGAWTSGGTLANDLTGSAVHLTNLSGWAPLNFGQPSLAAGTDGAVTASLFAYNKGVGGNNNLNITAGTYMWNGNWVSATPTAEAIVMNPTSISLQYSTGNTVGAGLGTWNNIAVFAPNGLVLPNTASSSLLFGSSTAPVGSILGYNPTGAFELTGGGYFDGTNWKASGTTFENLDLGAGHFYFQANTGLTAGASVSPTQIADFWSGGIRLPSAGMYYIGANPIITNQVAFSASIAGQVSGSCTATTNQGFASRVGNHVTVQLTYTGTCTAMGGYLQISGFPWANTSNTASYCTIEVGGMPFDTNYWMATCRMLPNWAACIPVEVNSNAPQAYYMSNLIPVGNTVNINMTCNYLTDSMSP